MTTLTLNEWLTAPDLELTASAIDILSRDFQAVVTPSPRARTDSILRWQVTPKNIVGVVHAGDETIQVRPKLPISNVLFLVGYLADPENWREHADLERTDDLIEAVATLFARLAGQATSRGLLHGYRENTEELPTVRGRIDFPDLIRRRPGQLLPLPVTYEEHDASIIENQLILATVELLLRLPIKRSGTLRALHHLHGTLAEVVQRTFDHHGIPSVSWTRLNQHYRPAVALARLILQGQTVDLKAGEASAAGLTIDMATVFEAFVRESLGRALRLSSDMFPDGDHCPRLTLDEARRVRLKPDLSWWHNGACKFVGDAKYKIDTGPGKDSDIYQLHAYATATALPNASLIYADGPDTGSNHRVVRDGPLLHIEHLDLSRHPHQILEQIEQLALRIAPDWPSI